MYKFVYMFSHFTIFMFYFSFVCCVVTKYFLFSWLENMTETVTAIQNFIFCDGLLEP